MPSVLVVYLQHPYTTESDSSTVPFDNRVFGELVGADIGYPLASTEETLQRVHEDRFLDAMSRSIDGIRPSASSFYHPDLCVTDPELMTTQVRLESGRVVNVDEYDTLLISDVWDYLFYITFLTDKTSATVLAMQEASVQEVASYAPALGVAHREMLDSVDGYLALNDQFENYVQPFVDTVEKLSLPVPKNQFESINSTLDRRDTICAGVTSWNLDMLNFHSNLMAVSALRNRGYDLRPEIIGMQSHHEPTLKAYEEHVDALDIVGFLDEGFYQQLGSATIGFILMKRATAGRVSAELAGLGVPCIGNRHNDLQSRCWPALSVDPFDVPKAVSLAERLLENDDFYDRVVTKAQRRIQKLQDHGKPRERLLELVKRSAAE